MGELLDNFLKVYQLANFIKHSQLQQQIQQQELAQRQIEFDRQRQQQDLANQLHLASLGATEATPGVEQAMAGLTEQLGPPSEPNPKVTIPGGRSYYVPRFEQQQQRLLDKIRTEGEAKANIAIGQAAMTERVRQQIRREYAKAPNLHFITKPIGEDMVTIGLDPQTGEEKSRSVEKGGAKGAGTNVRVDHYMDPATGTRVTEIRDPKTGDLIRKETERGAITPKPLTTGRESKTGLSAQAQKAWNQFEEEKKNVAKMPDGPMKDLALKDLTDQRNIVLAQHGDELQSGPSEGGWPDIQKKARAQAAAAVMQSQADPRIGKIFVGPNGTRYRVKGIAPSGKAIVEPVE